VPDHYSRVSQLDRLAADGYLIQLCRAAIDYYPGPDHAPDCALQRTASQPARDASQEQLVTATVTSMAKPCLYTVLTTMVAFLSLVVSNIRPVIDFGWMMTMGISLALMMAFIIIPAGMMLLGKGKNTGGTDNSCLGYRHIFQLVTEHSWQLGYC